MKTRVLALLLAGLLAVFSFTACKSAKPGENAKENGTTASAEGGTTGTQSGKTTEGGDKQAASDNAQGGDSGNTKSGTTTAAGGENAQASEQASDSKTGGWKQQGGGKLTKGDVRVNVAKYDSTAIADGEELIQQLIKGGMKGAKVLSSEKTEKTVIYKVSGKRLGGTDAEFVKFQFVPKSGTGYLVTVFAGTQNDLDTDISYVLSNLKELAV